MVYVDDLVSVDGANRPHPGWKYPLACSLFADTLEELHAMAQRLRLPRHWLHGGAWPRYDLTAQKRSEAVTLGARQITSKEREAIRDAWRRYTARS